MTTHRFVQIGDTHLQSTHPRNADRLDALDQIFAAGEQRAAKGELAAWLWPGDLYHTRSSIDDRNALVPRVQRMADLAPVVIVAGNHDAPGDLEILPRLATRWPIKVATTPQVLRLRTATDALAAIFCLPYPHRAGLVSAGADHASLIDEARTALDPIFIEAGEELKAAWAAGALPLVLGHVNIGGSIASTGQPQIGVELELDAALLQRLPPVYVGLNHIHKHQVLHGAVYAGSICRMDFGENEPKGYVEVSFAPPPAPDVEWEHDWRFVELQVPEQVRIEGRLAVEGFEFDDVEAYLCRSCRGDDVPCEGCDGTGRRSYAGADVRVRYRYRRAEASVIDVGHIERLFAGARSLKLEPDPQHEVEVRAPEIAQAKTLDEKLQHYCRRAGIDWTDSLAAKAAALQQPDGAALLAALESSLADCLEAPTKAKVA